jgi:hypothetical protein
MAKVSRMPGIKIIIIYVKIRVNYISEYLTQTYKSIVYFSI